MANTETCRGCQSFCMLGKQLVSADTVVDPDTKTEHKKSQTYSTTWKQWADIATNNTIQSANTLSAESQNSLISYIQAAWNEGNVNASNLVESVNEWNSKHSGGAGGFSPSIGTIVSYKNTNTDNAKANSGDVIYAKHYNILCNVLLESANGITENLKGESISNNATEGPIVGSASNRESNDPLVIKDDVIKAMQYTKLAERAGKLMYHPYQCNFCNIYEGGQWTEIVEDIGVSLYKANTPYSQSGTTQVTSNGYTMTLRRDCSGFVGACVSIFNATLTGQLISFQGASETYLDRGNLPKEVQSYFGPFQSTVPTKKGSITVRYATDDKGNKIYTDTAHVEVYGQWSGGGQGSEGSPMMHRIGAGSGDAGMPYLYDE